MLKQETGSPRVREDAGRSGRALLLVPLLGLLWGFNWPAVRISLTEIAPWTLRAAGMSFAGLVLVGIALARGVPLAVPRAQWPRLVVAGFLSIAAFNVLLAFAQLAAPTSRAAAGRTCGGCCARTARPSRSSSRAARTTRSP